MKLQDAIIVVLNAANAQRIIKNRPIEQYAESLSDAIQIGISKMTPYNMQALLRSSRDELSKIIAPEKYNNTDNSFLLSACRVLDTTIKPSSFTQLYDGVIKLATNGSNDTITLKTDHELSQLIIKQDVPEVKRISEYVPMIDETFVQWGDFPLLSQVVSSKKFFPIMITGLSGNGKSFGVEQACALNNREYFRVQINPETDESDLIGTIGLVDGNTVFKEGPVITAMRRGAVLLLDEFDRNAGNKLTCLMGILEGKPYLIKKTGEVITPSEGFTIFATSNTKGQGDETGKFSAASIIDEAFLERFPLMIEQEFAPEEIEMSILALHMKKFGGTQSCEVIRRLMKWVKKIRNNYENGIVDEYISSRRLCHILQIYSMTNDLERSVAYGVSRYDKSTKESFVEWFNLS